MTSNDRSSATAPPDRTPPDGRRDPGAGDGRGPAGQLRPSGHADGHGRDRGRAVGSRHLRHNPADPKLGRPRPLRAVQRPRLDAALRAAAPDRLRPAARGAEERSASCTRRRPAIPRSASRRASRPPPGRSGRGWRTRSAWRWPSACSPREFNRDGFPVGRPPHLGLRRRRLPDGGDLARGLLARRARCSLSRLIVLYDDNGISIDGEVQALVRRRHRAPLRGLRLERDRRRRRPRRRRARPRDRAGERLGAQRPRRPVRADADPVPHGDRQGLARTAPAPPRRTASRSAPTRSPRPARR